MELWPWNLNKQICGISEKIKQNTGHQRLAKQRLSLAHRRNLSLCSSERHNPENGRAKSRRQKQQPLQRKVEDYFESSCPKLIIPQAILITSEKLVSDWLMLWQNWLRSSQWSTATIALKNSKPPFQNLLFDIFDRRIWTVSALWVDKRNKWLNSRGK